MTISKANPQVSRDSNVEFVQGCSVGGRFSRFAGQILSVAPIMLRDLKVSVSSLALGSVVATSLMGGGSLSAELHED